MTGKDDTDPVEEILILLLQLLFELVLQLLIYGGIDFTLFSLGREDKEGRGCGAMVIFFFLGAALAGLANLVHPRQLLPQTWMRVMNLFATPLVAGGVSWLLAQARRRRGAVIRPGLHFFFAFWFALGFTLVRFVYGNH